MAQEYSSPREIAKARLLAVVRGTMDVCHFLKDAGLYAQANALWDSMERPLEALCDIVEPLDPIPPNEPNRPSDDRPETPEGLSDRELIEQRPRSTAGPPRLKRQRRLCQEAAVEARGAYRSQTVPRKYENSEAPASPFARAIRAAVCAPLTAAAQACPLRANARGPP